jgi:O-antigen/teichoic acid export membrane protein
MYICCCGPCTAWWRQRELTKRGRRRSALISVTNYLPRRLRPFLGKALFSIADQATSSSTNFVLNVLLARWLTRTGYGAFSVCWSLCVVFAALHNALILEPMTIVGPAEYHSTLRGYLRTVSRLNWYSVILLGLLAAAVTLFYREPEIRHALLALTICLPGYLLLLTARREQYVLNQPERALLLSLVYAALVAAVLAVLRALSLLSAVTGILCFGAALPVALLAGRRRAASATAAPPGAAENSRSVAQAHWTYGRWLFASSILAMGIPDVQTILLSVLVDLKSAGALRAMLNFIVPLAQLLMVLSVYTLPKLSRQVKVAGIGAGLRQILPFAVVTILLSVAYVVTLLFFAEPLERLLYGNRMLAYLAYLPGLAFAALLSAVGASFSTLLRAAQNSQHQFFAGIAGTLVGIGAALLLLRRYGLAGAIASMTLANAVSSACIVATYAWLVHKYPADWSAAMHFFRKDAAVQPAPPISRERG